MMMMRYEGTKIYMRKSTPRGLDICFEKLPIYGNHPPGQLVYWRSLLGFIGTLKVERLTPSTAFKKTHSKHGPEPAARFERIVLLKK